jgi:FSR family fosmidomycin resistance protein-like MFS transporter
MLGGLAISGLLFARLREVPGRPADTPAALPWRQALGAMGPLLGPLAGIVLLRGFLLTALTTYLPLFLSERGASLWLAGASLTVLEAAGVGGALLGGALSDRVGRRTVLFASFLLAPLFMFAFLRADGAAQFVLLVLMGMSALSVTPVVMALVQESFPENRALANGVYMAISFGLRSGAMVAFGVVADLFSLETAFLASAVLGLGGLPLVLFLRRRPVGG